MLVKIMLVQDQNKKNKKKYISLAEAAKYSSYSQDYLSLRARQGKLKSVKLGRNWVTKREWLEEYEGYISLAEAAKYSSYSQDYLSLRVRQGKLKSVKLGRNWVTKKEWVKDYEKINSDYRVETQEGDWEPTRPNLNNFDKLLQEVNLFNPQKIEVGYLAFVGITKNLISDFSSYFSNLNLKQVTVDKKLPKLKFSSYYSLNQFFRSLNFSIILLLLFISLRTLAPIVLGYHERNGDDLKKSLALMSDKMIFVSENTFQNTAQTLNEFNDNLKKKYQKFPKYALAFQKTFKSNMNLVNDFSDQQLNLFDVFAGDRFDFSKISKASLDILAYSDAAKLLSHYDNLLKPFPAQILGASEIKEKYAQDDFNSSNLKREVFSSRIFNFLKGLNDYRKFPVEFSKSLANRAGSLNLALWQNILGAIKDILQIGETKYVYQKAEALPRTIVQNYYTTEEGIEILQETITVEGEVGQSGINGQDGIQGPAGPSGEQGIPGERGPAGSGGGSGGGTTIVQGGDAYLYGNNTWTNTNTFTAQVLMRDLGVSRYLGSQYLSVADALSVQSDAEGGMIVNADATFNDPVVFNDTVTLAAGMGLSGDLSLTGNQSISGTLSVGGITTLSDNLIVGGALSITGTSTIATTTIVGDLTISGKATITDDLVISDTLTVSATSSLASTTIVGNLTVSEEAIFTRTPSTTMPAVLIESNGLNNFDTSTSTYLMVNADSGFSGNLIDLQIDGVSVYAVDSVGNIISAASYDGHFLPLHDNIYNIGSETARWRNGYFSNSLQVSNVGQTATTTFSVNNFVTQASAFTLQTDNAYDLNLIAGDDLEITATSTNITGMLTVSATTTLSSDLVVNTDTLFVDSFNNRVGIGTTTPAYDLSVDGTIQAQNYLTSGGSPVNDILLAQEVRNYSINSLKGSVGMDVLDWEEKVSATTFEAAGITYSSATALENGNTFIAYADDDNSSYGTFVIYDNSGTVVKSPTVFESASTSYISAATIPNGNVLVAYRGASNYGTFVIYDSAGNLIKSATVFESANVNNISVTTLTNSNILIAYMDAGNSNYGTFVIYDSAGNLIKSATVFESAATYEISATTLTNGNVLIAYQDLTNSRNGTFVIYDSVGNLIKSATVFDSGYIAGISVATITNGNVLIAYYDYDNSIYGTFVIYDSTGNLIKSATVFESAATYKISATTLTNGNVLIAYLDAGNSNYGTFVIYDSAGNLIKSATVFESADISYISATTLTNGNVLIAYRDGTEKDESGKFVIYQGSGVEFSQNLVVSGYMGIGTTSPDMLFHVGSSTPSSIASENYYNSAYISGDLEVDGTIYSSVSGAIDPGFTQGSIVFQGASGLAEDNTNFFWDDTNNRLGIGTTTPSRKLEIVDTANPQMRLSYDSSNYTDLQVVSNGNLNILPSSATLGVVAIGSSTATSDYELRVHGYDGSTNRYLALSHGGAEATIEASYGTTWIKIANNAVDVSSGVALFGNSDSGENRELRVYGYFDDDSRYGSFKIDDNNNEFLIAVDPAVLMSSAIQLADTAGATEFRVRDSDGSEVFSVDSDGNLTASGTATLAGGLVVDSIDSDLVPGLNNTYFFGEVTNMSTMDQNLSTADASFWGEDWQDHSGYSVASAGDVNGDGYDDLLIGAYRDGDGGGGAGQTYLILGKASGWSMDTDLSVADASFWGEEANDQSGYSVASAGDVNGDGYDDILIGAYTSEDGGSAAGQTYLILGKASGWAMDQDLSAADASFIGEDAFDRSGYSVASAGDVNGDGYDDILIGADQSDSGDISAGQTYLILGKASGWAMDTDLSAADASFWGEDSGDNSGNSVASAGDVNGDGYDDILIGAAEDDDDGNDSVGQTYLILGKASGWAMDQDLSAADASFIGEDAVNYAGISVSSAGDVNGDGYDDILIGAYQNSDGGGSIGTGAGQTYLILGKASGWAMDTDLSAADASFWGEDASDKSGISVASAGDVNGDGYDDILIGAEGDDDGGSAAGQTYLILGKASGWAMDTDLSAADASFWGEDSGDYAGYSVASAGDVNGDGYDDILIGAYNDEEAAGGPGASGQTYLILSNEMQFDSVLARHGHFGDSISVAGVSIFQETISSDSQLYLDANKVYITGGLELFGDLVVDTNTLFVDASAGYVGVGTTSPDMLFHVGSSTPSSIASGNYYNSAYISGDLEVDGTTYFDGDLVVTGTQTFTGDLAIGGMATVTALTGNIDTFGSISASSTLTAYATSTLASDLLVGTDSFFVNTADDRVGIGNIIAGLTPSSTLHINGGVGSLATGLSFGDGDTGFYESADNILYLATAGSNRWRFDSDYLYSVSSGGGLKRTGISATVPGVFPNSSDMNTGLGWAAADQLSLIAGAQEGIRVTEIGDYTSTTIYGDLNVTTGTTTLSNDLVVNANAFIDGINDQVQLTVQGHSTQTTDIFVVEDSSGADLFVVSETQVVSYVPFSMQGTGDVSIANDLYLSNATASYITSKAPLYIIAGDEGTNTNLVLEGRGTGKVYVDDDLYVTATTTIAGNLVLSGDMSITGTTTLTGNLVPSADDTYDLGSASYEWRDLYLDGTANLDLLSVSATSTLASDLLVGTDSFLVNTADDRVGIGNIISGLTPSSTLHINGGTGSLATGLTFGDGSTGIYETSDNKIAFGINSLTYWTMSTTISGDTNGGAGRPVFYRQGSATLPGHTFTADYDTGIGWADYDQLSLIAGAQEGIRISEVGDYTSTTIYGDLNVTVGTTTLSNDLVVDTDTLFVDSFNNRVGIGTASPDDPLHLLDDSGDGNTIRLEEYSSGNGEYWTFGTDQYGSLRFYNETSNFLTLTDANVMGIGSEILFDPDGNSYFGDGYFGIGTTSPDMLFHVGSTTPSSIASENYYNSAYVSGDLEVEGTSYAGTLAVGDGSVSLPSITFADDLNTGLYSVGADQLGLAVGGIQLMQLNSDEIFLNATTTIANNAWFRADNNVGDDYVNMFKVNTSDEIEVGAVLNVGPIELEADSGAVTLINLPVSSTPSAGDEESYSFGIDSNVILKVYAEADGTGGIQNSQVIVGQTLGSNANPSLAFGDGDTGFYEPSDDRLRLVLNEGINYYEFASSYFHVGSGAKVALYNRDASATDPVFVPARDDSDTGIGRNAADQLSLIAGEIEGIRISEIGDYTSTTIYGDLNVTVGTTTLSNDLRVDTNTLVVDSFNNRVGIGTTTPSMKLSVDGDALFNGDLSLANITATGTLTLGSAFNVGGVSGLLYNAISDSGVTSHSLASDDDLYIEGDLEVDGNVYFDGNMTIAGIVTTTGHIIPSVDDTYDLGSTAYRWRDLYLGPSTFHIGSNGDESQISYATASDLLTFQNSVDSTTGFQFLDADGGDPIFNIDTTNERIGIGTASPSYSLDVDGTFRVVNSVLFSGDAAWEKDSMYWHSRDDTLLFGQASGGAAKIDMSQDGESMESFRATYFSDSNHSIISAERANGTESSPSKTAEDDDLLSVIARGYDDSSFVDSASLIFAVDADTGASDMAGRIEFWTTPDGTSALTQKMVIKNDGNVGIGTTTPAMKFSVNGDALFNGDLSLANITATGSVTIAGDLTVNTSTTLATLLVDPNLIGSASQPSLAFGDGDTGFYESADDVLRLSVRGGNGGEILFASGYIYPNAAISWWLDNSNTSDTNPAYTFNGDTDTGIGRNTANEMSLIAGEREIARVASSSTYGQFIIDPAGALMGTGANPSLAFGTNADTGFYESADNILEVSIAGSKIWTFQSTNFGARGSAGDPLLMNETPSATNPSFAFYGDDNTGIGRATADAISIIAGATELMRLTEDTVNTAILNVAEFDINGLVDLDVTTTTYAMNIYNASTDSSAGGLYIQNDGGGLALGIYGESAEPLFTVDANQTTIHNPVSFENTGDVAIGSDLIFTESPAHIIGEGSLYLQTDSSWEDLSLYLSAANDGRVTVNDNLLVFKTASTSSVYGDDIGLEVEYTATDNGLATGNYYGLQLNVTQASNDGVDLYGLAINDLGGTASTGAEYAIYQAGTGWDYGLYLEDDARLATTTVTGYLGVGTSTPYAALSLVDTNAGVADDVFVISTSTSGTIFKVDGSGNYYYDGSASTPAADYAEYYYTKDTDLSAGEAVCVDVVNENAVQRCRNGADGNLMGIISTKPSIVGNAYPGYKDNENYVIVGMLGQVPAQVSNENGEIRPGDSLTSASSTLGYLMKADAGDPTVGVALEFLKENQGIVNVLISRRNKSITVSKVEDLIIDRIAGMEIEDEVAILVEQAVEDYNFASTTEELIGEEIAILQAQLDAQAEVINILQGDDYTSDDLWGFVGDAFDIGDFYQIDIQEANSYAIGNFNDIYVTGENSTGYGIYNKLSTANDNLAQTVFGTYAMLQTSDDKDAAFGSYITSDSNSLAGQQIGQYINLNNPNTENWAIMVDAGQTFFGDNVLIGEQMPVLSWSDFELNGDDLYVSGDAGIAGNLYIDGELNVLGDAQFVGNVEVGENIILGGMLLSSNSGYAEMLDILEEEYEFGDLVVMNTSSTTRARLADQANSEIILGVIAQNPAIITSKDKENGQAVVMSGTTLVNVSAANGLIKKGDYLTTANEIGKAQKVTKDGAGILGIALEDMEVPTSTPSTFAHDQILVRVQLGNYFTSGARVVEVAKSGGDFSTLTGALSSITNNSAKNKYIVKVKAGEYEETIIMKPYVDIICENKETVNITAEDAPVVITADDSRIEGCHLIASGTHLAEPIIVSINGTSPIIHDNILTASTTELAIGINIENTVASSKLEPLISNNEFSSHLYQGIVNFSDETEAIIMNNKLDQVTGQALASLGGRINSSQNQFTGQLIDIYVSEDAKFYSQNDQYNTLENEGIFVDASLEGGVFNNYIVDGWIVNRQAEFEEEDSFLVNISAGEGYLDGIHVLTRSFESLELYATSTNYIYMNDAGEIEISIVKEDTKGILLAEAQTDVNTIIVLNNDRQNEIVVAKQGGDFTTINEALEAIKLNSPSNRWLITVKPGIYNEQVSLKPYIDLVGSGNNNTKITQVDNTVIQSSSESSIQNIGLALYGDTLGREVISILASDQNGEASSTLELIHKFSLIDVAIDYSSINSQEVATSSAIKISSALNNLTSSEVATSSANLVDLEFDGLEINDSDIGIDWNIIDDNFISTTSTEGMILSNLEIRNSRINSQIVDLRTKAFQFIDFESQEYLGELDEEESESDENEVKEVIGDVKYYSVISSAYNMYIGSGLSFDLALGTELTTSHDNYGQVLSNNALVLDDFNRQVAQYDDLWLLQNNGKNVISVNGAGNILMSPQNVMVDSFSFSPDTSSTTLTVLASEGNEAARFYGPLVIGPALNTSTSTEQVAGISEIKFLTDAQISGVGSTTIKIGQASNTVDLNVEGVNYILPDSAIRDTITAFVDSPRNDLHIWGKGENSWNPPEDIKILKIKAQYYCGNNGSVDLVLEDENNQVLVELNGQKCSNNYVSIETEDLDINLDENRGMHIVVKNVKGGYYEKVVGVEGEVSKGNFVSGPSQLTITVEYVYRKELENGGY
jgi:FG-GAP repeat